MNKNFTSDNKALTDYDLELIESMKKHTIMICVKSSSMTRKYKVMTIYKHNMSDHPSIVSVNHVLKKCGYTVDKNYLIVIKGCGFSPVPDLAMELKVNQSVISEEYV